MASLKSSNWTMVASVAGALAWAVLATATGQGAAPLGVIELLFLFAPLVMVPLGLALASSVSPPSTLAVERTVRIVQPLAAACLVVSFWFSPGRVSGAWAIPWALTCFLVFWSGAVGIIRQRGLASFVVNVGRIDLALAGGWLMLSRLGIRPMDFQEPIVMLTAVHFHYSGFATAQIAAAGLRSAERGSGGHSLWRVVALAVAILPFLLAAGFVISPLLKATAASGFAIAVAALAVLLLSETTGLQNRSARGFLRVAGVCALGGMAWALAYALGEYLHADWITIPRMASRHGLLNALGFVLPGLLGWLIETQEGASQSEGESLGERTTGYKERSSRIRISDNRRVVKRPDFAAREFYER